MLGFKEATKNANHAELLAVMINDIFKELGLAPRELDAVAVSAGPGSYTGLRIGVATGKGICYALTRPLIAIDSLQALSSGIYQHASADSMLCVPTIDARRNEIYYGIFGKGGEVFKPSLNNIVSPEFLADYMREHHLIIGGSGVLKCRQILGKHSNVAYDDQTLPSSRWMMALSEIKWRDKMFEDLFSFEPFYIKPVYINTPRH